MNNPHAEYLQLALTFALKGKGACAPNPAVGVVIVKNNQVIATGYHQVAGEAHAEAVALQQLPFEASLGATAYITLEPCCHQGKTPPCTQLLIDRGIKTVYYGFQDPNPLVLGQGEKQLRAANIDCTHLSLPEIDAFYQSYQYWIKTQLPYVTAKLAMSLDGKIAGPQGERSAITGSTAQAFTHEYRRQSDAILTTVRSVINDDPQLNIREGDVQTARKTVYVLDKHLDFPLGAKLFQTAEKIILFHQRSADEKRRLQLVSNGVQCVPMDMQNNQIDTAAVLTYIGEAGVHDLLLEAGGICFESFMLKKHVQRAFVYVALKWLGPEAQSAFDHVTSIFNQARDLKWHILGQDVVCEFCP
jgi:diaminohydroxyphosphoribosylaminopyrimidine deaminase/5-amino-6-(5-phosphoribosylamino)uracil reductase